MGVKTMQFSILINGKMDGTLMSAVKNATAALKQLKSSEQSAMNRPVGVLQSRLTELNQLQKALQQYAKLQGEVSSGKVGNGQFKALQDALRYLKAANIDTTHFVQSMMQLSAAASKTAAAIKQVGDAAKRLGEARLNHQSAADNVNNAISNLSSATDTSRQLLQPFISSVETAATYEAAVSRVKSLTQMDSIREGDSEKVEREMSQLMGLFREIGSTTRYTQTQAAEAGAFLATAGWDTSKIVAGLKPIVNLAIANNMGVEQTADIMSNIMQAFGMEATAENQARVADQLTYTTTHSNQNLVQLGETLKYAAPVAKAVGVSLQEALAASKFQADAGVQASMGGTALRSLMLRMVMPPKQAREQMMENGIFTSEDMKAALSTQQMMESYGIDPTKGDKEGGRLLSLLQQFEEKMPNATKDERLNFISALAGKNATSGALNVFAGGFDQMTDFIGRLDACTGAAQQTADVMADNLSGSWVSFQSALEAASISVGDAFIPVLRPMVDGLTSMTRSVAQFAAENPGLIRAIGSIAAASATAIASLGAVNVVLAGARWVTTGLEVLKASAAFKMLTAQISGVSTVFSRIGGIFAAFRAGGLAAGFTSLGGAIGTALTAARAFIFTPWGAAIAGLSVVLATIYSQWDKVGPYFESVGARIMTAFNSAFESVSPSVSAIGDSFMNLVETIGNSGLGEALTGVFMVAVEVLTGFITTAITMVGTLISTVSKVGSALMEAFSLLIEGRILDAIKKVVEALSAGLGGVLEMLEEVFGGIYDTVMKIADIAGGLWNGRIFRGEFDYRSEEGRKESRAKIEERVNASVEQNARLKETETERVTLGSRNILRENKTDAETARTLSELIKGQGAQTSSRQEEMLTLIAGELRNRQGMTEDRSASMLSSIREQISEVRQSTASAIGTDLIRMLATKDMTNDAAMTEFLSTAREMLSQTTLTATEQNAALMEVARSIAQERSSEKLALELKEAFSNAQLESLQQRDAFTQTLLTRLTEDKSNDASTKLEAAARALEEQKALTSTMRTEMMTQLQEGLQRATDERLGESVATAIREAQSESALTEQLTGLLAAQEDKSAASMEMMMQTVQSALEKSNTRSGEEITSVLSTVQESLSAAMEAQQTAAAETFTQLQSGSESAGLSLEQAGLMAQQMGLSAQTTSGFIEVMNGGLTAAGSASNDAAGSITGLGSSAAQVSGALSAQAAAISSIQINVPQVNYVPMNVPMQGVAHNAIGGIYPRGAFLTTFAENSAEAAIPIDNSSRAKNLWYETGAMMGMFPKQKEKKRSAKSDNIFDRLTMSTPLGKVMPPLVVHQQEGRLEREMSTFDRLSTERERLQTVTSTGYSDSMPLTLNFTFNGSVDKEGVKAGVREMLPTFEEQMMRFRHEERRRAF